MKKVVYQTPFKSFKIQLHAGEPVVVHHPEKIIIGDRWVGVWRDPDPPIIFEAEMVVAIDYVNSKHALSRK